MKLTWIFENKGKKYGSIIDIGIVKNKKEIKESVNIISNQINLSLQKIILGKDEIDELIVKVTKQYETK